MEITDKERVDFVQEKLPKELELARSRLQEVCTRIYSIERQKVRKEQFNNEYMNCSLDSLMVERDFLLRIMTNYYKYMAYPQPVVISRDDAIMAMRERDK